MRVLITGASGLVGGSLARRLSKSHDVAALSHRDLDITSDSAIAERVSRQAPDLIINCAVIGVDECERDPALARRINVDGPRHLAVAAEKKGSAFLHFSTNYVFDGRLEAGAYTTADAPRAVNVYGAMKAEGEGIVLSACRRAFVVRTSWVFGRGKSSFLSTAASKLAGGERIRAIVDAFASCTYVEDLTMAVTALIATREYGLHHIVNDGVCSYESFALEAAALAAADSSLIDRIQAEQAYLDAPRPRYTPLAPSVAPLRNWREALRAYLVELRMI